MEEGEKIPSERKLCTEYNVSRTTVRNAINDLCLNGYLVRIQGKGTFVKKDNSQKQNLSNYYSFTEQTKKIGKVPESLIVDFHIEKCNKIVAKNLNIKKDDLVIHLLRLRKADGEAMMLELTFIPYDKFQKISKELLERKPLYEIFETEYDSKIHKVNEIFSVSALTKEQAKYLNSKPNDPCLKIQRKSYDCNDAIIEYTVSFAREDKFNYQTTYYPN